MDIDSLGQLSESSLKILRLLLQENKPYLDSVEIGKKTKLSGKNLGSSLSALSKIKFGKEPLLKPWGRKSMTVTRLRKGKKVDITLPIQVWKINVEAFSNKEPILKRIDEILEVLKQ